MFVAIAIGMVSLIKLSSLPAVILSLILGTLIGELLRFDDKIKGIFGKAISRMHFQVEGDRREYMNFYVTVAAVFCASGTNIFGAFSEGMTGDFTVLLSKASMDIFASLIFAAVLGAAMLHHCDPAVFDPRGLFLCQQVRHAAYQRTNAGGFHCGRRPYDARARLRDRKNKGYSGSQYAACFDSRIPSILFVSFVFGIRGIRLFNVSHRRKNASYARPLEAAFFD